MPTSPAILLELINRAAEQPIGLFIGTTNVHRLKNEFYDAITKIGMRTTDFDIMIVITSIENVIYLMRKSVELEP